jgi:hypothetical protein
VKFIWKEIEDMDKGREKGYLYFIWKEIEDMSCEI